MRAPENGVRTCVVSNMRELTRLCRFERYATYFSGCSERKHSSQTSVIAIDSKTGAPSGPCQQDEPELQVSRLRGTELRGTGYEIFSYAKCNHLGCHERVDRKMSIFRVQGCAGVDTGDRHF